MQEVEMSLFIRGLNVLILTVSNCLRILRG